MYLPIPIGHTGSGSSHLCSSLGSNPVAGMLEAYNSISAIKMSDPIEKVEECQIKENAKHLAYNF